VKRDGGVHVWPLAGAWALLTVDEGQRVRARVLDERGIRLVEADNGGPGASSELSAPQQRGNGSLTATCLALSLGRGQGNSVRLLVRIIISVC
jgi:hypothetical protein